ncbi:hypothetical protein HYV82_01230 [Candidatus Woesearchaeota archaeon]|nr:hypothetical protein [Candidatus Woesearchaeota archaeon]
MDAFTCLGDLPNLSDRVVGIQETAKIPVTCMTGGVIQRPVNEQPSSPSYCYEPPTLEHEAATAARIQEPQKIPYTCMAGGIILGTFSRQRPVNGQPRGLSSCYEPPSREEVEARREHNTPGYKIPDLY